MTSDRSDVAKGPSAAIRAAQRIWETADSVDLTHGARYLGEGHAITRHAPQTIRYHRALWHSESRRRYPALVAAMCQPGAAEVRGVLRIYLDPEVPEKAPVARPTALLGACGGAAVNLAPECPRIVVCAGLESGLSIQEAMEDRVCVLATGSTSLIGTLRLPDTAREIVHARDGAPAGSPADAAASQMAACLMTHDRLIRTAYSPPGDDFNAIHCRDGLPTVRRIIEESLD